MSMTVEQISRMMTEQFNDYRSVGGVKRLVDSRLIERVSREHDDQRQSLFNWRVSIDSVIQYLRGKGYEQTKIDKVFF